MQNAPSTSTLLGVSFPDINNGWAVGVDGVVLKADNIVPVELTAFNAIVNENDVTLSWQTATETNNSGFEIERLQNYKIKRLQDSWEDIGFVEGNGTTTEEHNYSFVDKNVSVGQYHYRLKQIDFDGSFEYSEIVNVSVSGPTQFSLGQNYPNPFNPSTKIEYSIPVNGNVRLTIFNSLGKEMEKLVNNYQQAGNHEVRFDASNMSSGVYYYKIESQNFSDVKKMILIR